MRTWTIYKHTLIIDCPNKGKSYIGQTTDITMRWKSRGSNYRHCNAFYPAIKKYGWDAFSHEILETGIITIEEANKREQYWIAYYHTYIHDDKAWGYNLTTGGSNVCTTYKWTDESKNKLSKSIKGHKVKQETIDKIKATQIKNGTYGKCYVKGRHLTDEEKQHLREINLGTKHGPHSTETKKKLSEKAKQRDISAYDMHRVKVLCVETGIIYNSLIEAAKAIGLKASTSITACFSGKAKTAGGYHWQKIK